MSNLLLLPVPVPTAIASDLKMQQNYLWLRLCPGAHLGSLQHSRDFLSAFGDAILRWGGKIWGLIYKKKS